MANSSKLKISQRRSDKTFLAGAIIAHCYDLAITLAATAFRAHHWAAAAGALIGGTASIGWMAYVNFVINSDFKWVLLGMALLWGSSLVLFVIEKTILRNGQARKAEGL